LIVSRTARSFALPPSASLIWARPWQEAAQSLVILFLGFGAAGRKIKAEHTGTRFFPFILRLRSGIQKFGALPFAQFPSGRELATLALGVFASGVF
jgi:hypothetical protein